jgi:hypothetical protein
MAKIRITYQSGSASILVSSPSESGGSLNVSNGNVTLNASGTFNGGTATLDVLTDTSQHIQIMAGVTGTEINESTYGWVDSRGRLN